MNHDNAHCLDYTSECPTTCYRARLTQELKDNPSIVRMQCVRFICELCD